MDHSSHLFTTDGVPNAPPPVEPAVAVRALSKSYGVVKALDGVGMDFFPGEVHAVAGENGAGKSTLTRLLSGEETPDAGLIIAGGKTITLRRPGDATRAGIAVVHQHFELIDTLNVAENIYLDALPRRLGGILPLLDRQTMLLRAAGQLAMFGLEARAACRISELSMAERQIVEIARALSRKARLLVLDEPVSALNSREANTLFQHVRALRERGMAIIFIAHNLSDVLSIADRVTVLRDGRLVASAPANMLDAKVLTRLIAGREVHPHRHRSYMAKTEMVLQTSCPPGPEIAVTSGEILGLPMHIGSGVRGLFDRLRGEMRSEGCPVMLREKDISTWSIAKRVRAGVCFVPGDASAEGLVPKLSIEDNIILPNIARFRRFGVIRRGAARAAVRQLVQSLEIRPADTSMPVERLSGGNRQKVAIAKWLLAGAQVLILDDPMRGVDVGAKVELYRIISGHAAKGGATLLASSDVDELLSLADHLVVLRGDTVAARFTDRPFQKEAILAALQP
jgi:ABC-type sugar transport system ATPase subunit